MSLTLWTMIAEASVFTPGRPEGHPGNWMHLQCMGRLGAQVALLQSPILPTAGTRYVKNSIFEKVPIDKPHTGNPWLKSLVCLCLLLVLTALCQVKNWQNSCLFKFSL